MVGSGYCLLPFEGVYIRRDVIMFRRDILTPTSGEKRILILSSIRRNKSPPKRKYVSTKLHGVTY
jgi:hypothetical protein